MSLGWGSDSGCDGSSRGATRRVDPEQWWYLNGTIRFYGFVLLAGTKSADAITTAVGLRYVPGIVEMDSFANVVFADSGTFTGLAVLSFATVAGTVLGAELIAIEVRRRLRLDRLALLAKAAIYVVLSALFGAISVNNAIMIADQVQWYVSDLLVAVG
jgi:hypothetical protein